MDRGWACWRRWRGGLGWGSGRVVDSGVVLDGEAWGKWFADRIESFRWFWP